MERYVDLFEYQARDIFEKHGVPVLAAAIATTADEAEAAATKIGGKVVVKGPSKSWRPWKSRRSKTCRKSS